jgi:hypothetical protein
MTKKYSIINIINSIITFMVKIFNKDTGDLIGEITESQLQFLIDNLEEESDDDVDYYINIPTIESFGEKGAEAGLIEVLKKGLGDKEDMEIRYEKE